MKMKFLVSDTVTYLREQTVELDVPDNFDELSQEELEGIRGQAITKAEAGEWDESQTDNTPYEVTDEDGNEVF